MPVVFVGHGSPMNAIDDNTFSRAFKALGEALPVPKAYLAVSAHWYLPATLVTGNPRPKTIHDFGGFPPALYEIDYPASGHVDLAHRVRRLVGESRASLSTDWGIDHGTWSVLVHLRPAADVPVIQLSIHARLSPADHVALGRQLAPLRDEGVMVLASGNITHNLRHAFANLRAGVTTTPQWAAEFDRDVAQAIEQHDTAFLTRALDSDAGRQAHPTPDHYLPLLYAMGAATVGEPVRFPITGFDAGSLSMRAAVIG